MGIDDPDGPEKKPHNITIKNFNPNEPKTRKSQLLHSVKKNYRGYKTKTEPNLLSEIMVDGEEDSIAKIRKEFGIDDETRKYYMLLLLVETSGGGTSHHEEPNKY